ncbi:MAG: T9SS type A sorting domain-containing protein [Ignavibacteriaceae bacterium]|nr:T9SS type A sorting domain-containing protein [Ignavibacteriaceae bacterium]
MKNFNFTRISAVIIFFTMITSFSIAQSWQIQNSNTSVQLKGIQMISVTEGWACGDAGAILHTIDAGNTWSLVTLTGSDLHQIVFKDASTGIVVGDNGTVFTTTNGGTNWISKNSSTSLQLRGAGFAGGSTFFAVGDDGAAVKSTDNGNTWTTLNSGTSERLLCVAAVDQSVWVGARNGLMLFSSNGGTSFTSMSNPATDDIKDIQFIDGSIGFAGGSNSFFMYTSNGGANWTSRSTGIQVGLNGLHFVNQNEGWVVGGAGTLYSTTNAGLNWIVLQSQTGQDLNSIHSVDGANAWAVGNLGVIVTNYSPPTNVENENSVAPNTLVLEQNYPNPFNPLTKIKFSVPERSNTIIKVYNTVGSEVATLLNEVKQPGTYEVDFNAADLSSGAYFYSMETDNFREVKKMILIK